MVEPALSVVVPFFQSERHFAACIESLLGQVDVDRRFEILLIDNGSADGSAAIAQHFAAAHPHTIQLLEEGTPGAYAARNAGLRVARAPLIALTDADCIADPNWLRSIQDGMEDPQIGALVGHCRYPQEASLGLRLLGAYENAKTRYVIEKCPPAHHFAYANNMAVRASIFEKLGGFKEWKRAADSELVHRLAASELELRLAYRPSMRITHLEFLEARQRARRLSLYTQTNSKIESFRELSITQRLGVLLGLLRGGG